MSELVQRLLGSAGMTMPRQVLPGTTYLLTRRTVQREFLLTHGTYAGTFSELGFNIESGAHISPTEIQGYTYNYRIIQDQGPRSWYVIATGNIDGDPFPDIIAASNPR